MNKKLLVSMLLVLSVIIVSSLALATVNAQKINLEELTNAVSLREVYGLNIDENYISNLFTSSETTFVLGVPFTKEELTILEQRDKVYNDLPNVEKIIRGIDNNLFGGLYYDAKSGLATVKLVNKASPDIVNQIKHDINFKNNIIFEDAEFSLDELTKVKEIISENKKDYLKDFPITDWGVDITKNRVTLGITQPLTDDQKEKINQLVDPKMIEYTDGHKIYFNLYENELRQKQDKIYGGVQIKDEVGECSAGFHAKDSSNNNILVTAGHCDDVNSTQTWYHPSKGLFGANSIGKWARRTSGDTSADAGYIRISSASMTTEKVYPGIPIFSVQSTNQEYIGMPVCRIGRTTGQRCGSLQEIRDFNMNSHGYTTLRNQRVYSGASLDGDSGGTVFRIFYAEGGTQEYQLVGVHSASDGTSISVYSHIRNVLSTLGISANSVLTK